MSLKNIEIKIEDDSAPFANCHLNRGQYADMLTQLVKNYPDGFVMSLNNKWGTGKSTFLRMWQQQLKNEEYETILFNAWENDFENNPLAALLGELSILTDSDNATFKKVLSTAAIILKNVMPTIAQGLAERYIGEKGMKELAKSGAELAKAGTQALAVIFEEQVEEYSKKKKGIKDFKILLEQFVKENCNGKPLIFMIDELDRCRPNYSVSVLEQIKHFFSVSGIVFVLSIDKEQLGYAVNGVYNSDKIDTTDYLRRFIDFEYSLPDPKPEDVINYYYELLDYDYIFAAMIRESNWNGYEGADFIKMSKILLGNLTLRQQQKILTSCRVSLRLFNLKEPVIPPLLIFLVFLKHTEKASYDDICKGNLKKEDLKKLFSEILISHYEQNKELIDLLEFYLYFIYYKSLPASEYTSFISKRSGIIEFGIDTAINADFQACMQNMTIHCPKVQNYNITYFTDKINLTSLRN